MKRLICNHHFNNHFCCAGCDVLLSVSGHMEKGYCRCLLTGLHLPQGPCIHENVQCSMIQCYYE